MTATTKIKLAGFMLAILIGAFLAYKSGEAVYGLFTNPGLGAWILVILVTLAVGSAVTQVNLAVLGLVMLALALSEHQVGWILTLFRQVPRHRYVPLTSLAPVNNIVFRELLRDGKLRFAGMKCGHFVRYHAGDCHFWERAFVHQDDVPLYLNEKNKAWGD